MFKLLLGFLLIPAACGAAVAAAHTLGSITAYSRLTLPFSIGFVGYCLVRLYVFQPVRIYILGHELSHAMAAWMSGARVLDFFVSKKGGHVDLSHSNAFIALAPYVFPFYAMIVIVFYRLVLWLRPLSVHQGVWAHRTFLAAMGAALSFHLLHTADALWSRHQPDLDQAGGIVFSLTAIVLVNALFLILALKCLFPSLVSVAALWTAMWSSNLLVGHRLVRLVLWLQSK